MSITHGVDVAKAYTLLTDFLYHLDNDNPGVGAYLYDSTASLTVKKIDVNKAKPSIAFSCCVACFVGGSTL